MSAALLLAHGALGPRWLQLPEDADPVLFFADQPGAVYTAFRSVHGDRFLGLTAHLARLAESARRAGLPALDSPDSLRRSLAALMARTQGDQRVLIEVLAQPMPALDPDARVFLAAWPLEPLDPALYQQGVRAVLAPPDILRPDPVTKTSAWRADRLAGVVDPSAFEHLLLDPQGGILEGYTSNFLAVRDGRVYTAGAGVLQGITRRLLLEVLAQQGVPVVLEPWPASRLAELDEAGICSSTRDLVPVVQIGPSESALVIGNGRPGPILTRALAGYRARVAAESAPAWPVDAG